MPESQQALWQSDNTLEEGVIWSLLLSEVQSAIEQLPEPQREVLIRYCYQELGYAEIAAAMGVTVGTVKSRIHYARINLRRRLSPVVRDALDALMKEDKHE